MKFLYAGLLVLMIAIFCTSAGVVISDMLHMGREGILVGVLLLTIISAAIVAAIVTMIAILKEK